MGLHLHVICHALASFKGQLQCMCIHFKVGGEGVAPPSPLRSSPVKPPLILMISIIIILLLKLMPDYV